MKVKLLTIILMFSALSCDLGRNNNKNNSDKLEPNNHNDTDESGKINDNKSGKNNSEDTDHQSGQNNQIVKVECSDELKEFMKNNLRTSQDVDDFNSLAKTIANYSSNLKNNPNMFTMSDIKNHVTMRVIDLSNHCTPSLDELNDEKCLYNGKSIDTKIMKKICTSITSMINHYRNKIHGNNDMNSGKIPSELTDADFKKNVDDYIKLIINFSLDEV